MPGIVAALAIDGRMLDVGFAVAVLLAVASLQVRLAWQPAKRLWIVQWSLIGGLVIAISLVLPWSRFSLGIFGSNHDAMVATFQAPETARAPRVNPVDREATPATQPAITADSPINPAETSAEAEKSEPAVIPAPVPSQQPNAGGINWLGWIAKIYLAGMAAMLLWLAFSQYSVCWLVRRAREPDATLLNIWQALQTEMQPQIADGARQNLRLLVSNDLAHPVAVGLFRPAVLLPRWFVESHAGEKLRPILAHEMAHVLHRDALLRWVAAAFQVVFFYQPLFWWLQRELRLCQEYLADAQAAKWAKSAPEYATQLVELLKAAPSQPRRPLPAIGIVEGRSELYHRIQMLVSTSTNLQPKISRRWSITTAAALLIFAPLLGLITLQAADAEPPAKTPAIETEKAADKESVAAEKPADEEDKNATKYRYRIVDTQGKPVVGAKVQVWAFSYNGGSSGGPAEEFLPSATTDAEGIATLVMAATGDDKIHREKMRLILQNSIDQGIRRLALKIDHPDHPPLSEYFEVNTAIPIVLQDSTLIGVRAHREGDKSPLDRLYPAISGNTVDWENAKDMLKIRRVDMNSQNRAEWLRIVRVPEKGPAEYSQLIDLKEHTGNPIFIDAVMKPGVRVDGKLDEQVPRPVKAGRVVAAIVHRGGLSPWYFSVVTDIAADGTFAFESLPYDENLQVVAICDGWVSSTPTAEDIQAYRKQHNVSDFANEPRGGYQACPQLVRLQGAVVKPTIDMEATAACEVTVTDDDGKPLPNARVAFWPNQYFYNSGSNIVGEGFDQFPRIREMLNTGNHNLKISQHYSEQAYSAITDDRGIATIRNLPVGKDDKAADRNQSFAVWREGYTVVGSLKNFGHIGDSGILQVKNLLPGQTTKVSAKMRKVAPPQANLPAVGENELAGQVLNEFGKPIEGVEVLVWERDEEKIRTDKDGKFRHKFEVSHGDEAHMLVRFKKPGYAPHLVVDWKLGLKDQLVVLDTTTYFEGVVTRPDGKPAANVLVRANQGPKQDNPGASIGEIWTETRTDENGKYKLLVQPDTYAIDVRAPGIGTARVPKDGEQGDRPEENADLLPKPQRPKIAIEQSEVKKLDIKLEPGVDFRAQIVDLATGKPVPNVRLWHWQHPGIEGRTNEDGLVLIPTMPSGEFTFMVEAPAKYIRGWSPAVPERWKKLIERSATQDGREKVELMSLNHGLPFDLKADMPQVTISLEPGVTISGKVIDPDGRPVGGATIAPTASGQGHGSGHIIPTKDDGSFVVVLPPTNGQKYNLIAHDGEYRKWRKWANGVGPVMETKPGQTIDNVELQLTRPGVIRGRTVDTFGKPTGNVYVQTTAEDRLENNYYNPATRSDKDGNFELPFVRPGRHLVHSWVFIEDPATEEHKFPIVEVKAGEITKVGDVVVPPQYQDQR